jgi:hypothetical protein
MKRTFIETGQLNAVGHNARISGAMTSVQVSN